MSGTSAIIVGFSFPDEYGCKSPIFPLLTLSLNFPWFRDQSSYIMLDYSGRRSSNIRRIL
jgi:hypothetical protein